MKSMSYSTFRGQLASVLDKVNDDHVPILITRQSGKPAVVVSLEDYKSYEEMAYLMSSEKNAERINQAIQELESGKGQPKDLLD